LPTPQQQRLQVATAAIVAVAAAAAADAASCGLRRKTPGNQKCAMRVSGSRRLRVVVLVLLNTAAAEQIESIQT